jgi:hypothetical protein
MEMVELSAGPTYKSLLHPPPEVDMQNAYINSKHTLIQRCKPPDYYYIYF